MSKHIEKVVMMDYEAALAARKTEWNGEGLPPVGCRCARHTS